MHFKSCPTSDSELQFQFSVEFSFAFGPIRSDPFRLSSTRLPHGLQLKQQPKPRPNHICLTWATHTYVRGFSGGFRRGFGGLRASICPGPGCPSACCALFLDSGRPLLLSMLFKKFNGILNKKLHRPCIFHKTSYAPAMFDAAQSSESGERMGRGGVETPQSIKWKNCGPKAKKSVPRLQNSCSFPPQSKGLEVK